MKIAAIVSVSVLGLASTAARADIATNPAGQFPLSVSAEQPAFLFPINMSHLNVKGGNPTAMGVTVTAGVAAGFGKEVVSGQQLFDLVGNLSYDLAEQIRGQATKGTWTMTGPAERTATDLATKMEVVLKKLADAKLIPATTKFRYVIALHSHGSSQAAPGASAASSVGGMFGKKAPPPAPAMLNVESWGGIYDIETKQILSYVKTTNTYANQDKAVLAELPAVYNSIISELLQGKTVATK